MSNPAHPEELQDIAASLSAMGLIGDGEQFAIGALSGGVSCDVYKVEVERRAPFVVKRALPKLRVAAAESFAYGAWAGEFARSRELQKRAGRIKNLTTVLNAVYLPLCSLLLFVLLAGPARGSLSASAFLTFNTAMTMLLTAVTQLTGDLVTLDGNHPLAGQNLNFEVEVKDVRQASAEELAHGHVHGAGGHHHH